ncbi:hypothetical protein [Ferrovibrio terrae]|jgi:hypothetical protein|uniref:DUF6898 family protein n=1 Tax=Ferrovibrio terrae TaxID=2594003 RepID=UPI0031376DCC
MSDATGSDDEDWEAIVEFRRYGTALQVIAIDPDTGKEVSMVGDPRLSRDELGRLAVQKLRYVLNKQRSD